MKQPIKVLLPSQHSAGRGIGFYARHLTQAFQNLEEVKLVEQDPDLIHYPYFDLFYPSLPLIKKAPILVTVHDLTPLVLSDLYPQGIRARLSLFYQRLSLKSVSAVLTDSQNSKQDIKHYFNLPLEKIHVTPLAVDPLYRQQVPQDKLSQIKKKYQLPDRFILYVGGVNPNKNLPALIQAALNLKVPLVLVGSEFTKDPKQTFSFKAKLGLQTTHPELKQLELIKEKIAQSDSVQALGFVSTPDLAGIYRLATLYCQPSLYEGFGLPVLEAMTCGCLVVSSQTSSLPEIYSSNTINFDPYDQAKLQSALQKALNLSSAQKEKLITEAREKADQFSWQKTAQKTLAVYQKVLAR